jgi:hypothetical protein
MQEFFFHDFGFLVVLYAQYPARQLPLRRTRGGDTTAIRAPLQSPAEAVALSLPCCFNSSKAKAPIFHTD